MVANKISLDKIAGNIRLNFVTVTRTNGGGRRGCQFDIRSSAASNSVLSSSSKCLYKLGIFEIDLPNKETEQPFGGNLFLKLSND